MAPAKSATLRRAHRAPDWDDDGRDSPFAGDILGNPIERGDYDSKKNAAMSLRELERYLGWEIAGGYHERIHSGLQRSPLGVWREQEAQAMTPRAIGDASRVPPVPRRDAAHRATCDPVAARARGVAGSRRSDTDPHDRAAFRLHQSLPLSRCLREAIRRASERGEAAGLRRNGSRTMKARYLAVGQK